jgi:hypothetical protein
LITAGTAQVEPIGDDDEVEKAMQQLRKLADRERARSPGLTSERAFARAFKENPALAAKAHRRPAPTTVYPFPR